MNRRVKRSIFLLLILALTLFAVASVAAQGNSNNFRAHLHGGEEVPPVDTNAQGQVIVKFNSDGSLSYKVIVANIKNVRVAHIHCGVVGVSGPIGVTLYGGPTVTTNGILAQATVTAPDAGNACGWETIGDVLAAAQSGGAYVNVHTDANPPGEIRGQLH